MNLPASTCDPDAWTCPRKLSIGFVASAPAEVPVRHREGKLPCGKTGGFERIPESQRMGREVDGARRTFRKLPP